MEPLLPLLAFAVFAGLALWWGWWSAKKRRELIAAFAQSQGWTWTERDDHWADRFGGDPFDQGDSREVHNVLTGTWQGREMLAFDYSYETHTSNSKGGRQTTTHRFAVCALAIDAVVPTFELVPEGFLGRVGTLLGMDDIELESEDFNRRYRVRCADGRLAYDLLPARTMEALLARPALHLRISGADALCWESGSHSLAELLARLDTLRVLLDGVPAHVWTDLKGSAP